jgi:hypothetical protein
VAVVQISKIQHRRGKETISGGIPQLASAELGWAIDTQKLYIGNGSVSEGAPAVGNTEILTANTNLFDLLNQYEYKGNTGAFKQTGVFANDPVIRTVQQRLDDVVSIKSFGAVGNGVTDDTAAIQRAIDSLFLNSGDKFDPRSRVSLKIEAGVYKLTNTIYIPPFANLIGDGKEKTIFKLFRNPSEALPGTARPIIQTVAGNSNPGTYVTYSNIVSQERPRYITLKGISFEVHSEVTVHDAIFKMDNMTESTIDDCKFKGTYVRGGGYNIAQTGIMIRGLGALTSEQNLITNTEFENLSIGVYSVQDVKNINFDSNLFNFLHTGIDLARTSTGTGSQKQGPRNFIIKGNIFDKIEDFGIAVWKPNATVSPTGHTSTGNSFLDVANNNNGQNSPQTAVIMFQPILCDSVGDYFERDSYINTAVATNVPYKPTVDGNHYTKGRMNTATLNETDSFNTFTKLPFTKDKIAYVDYLLVKTGASATTRQGRLTVTINNSTAQVTDSFSHLGSSDGGVSFSASLDNMDSTAGNETVLIKYRNPIGNGSGTLRYAISYFA